MTATAVKQDLLFPLSEVCSSDFEWQPRGLEAGELEEPYRSLLVHERDMTSTLEDHHREPLILRVLEKCRRGEILYREVVLVGETSARPVEFGAIRIDLELFEPAARRRILEGRRPLGALLADFAVPYESHPRRFFALESDALIDRALELESSRRLYGRQNVLSSPAGRPLAEVVEILPPS